MTLTVAIIGRPNVGKSTLFNRLVGRRLALVDDTPGVTRDWREGEGRLGPLSFRLIDTAGLDEGTDDSLPSRMSRQTEAAMGEADVTLLLVDARAGITPLDRYFAKWLRRRHEQVLLVANKCEGGAGQAGLMEAYELDLGEPLAVSAAHGEGLSELYDALESLSPVEGTSPGETEAQPLKLAILGRPNVGKSTLVNRLVGRERMLTGPEPGITRDAVAVDWVWQDRPVRLFDTAGLRRRARVTTRLEKLSAGDAMRAMAYAEVVVLLVDGSVGIERQELTIASRVVAEGRALAIALNKWDLVSNGRATRGAVSDRLKTSLTQASGVSVVTLSGMTGLGIDDLMAAVFEIHERWQKRLSTGVLNRWLEAVIAHHPPPLGSAGRRVRLRYITQVKSRPPTFVIFCNDPGGLPDSYVRYLQNGLREAFELTGVPLRVHLRKPKNPYA